MPKNRPYPRPINRFIRCLLPVGYIDLGIRRRNQDGTFAPLTNLAPTQTEARIRAWKATGTDGIFFDDID